MLRGVIGSGGLSLRLAAAVPARRSTHTFIRSGRTPRAQWIDKPGRRVLLGAPLAAAPFATHATAPPAANIPHRTFHAPTVDAFRLQMETEGFLHRCWKRLRMAFRTIAIGCIATIMASTGLIVYGLPLVPEFARRWWRGSLVTVLGYCGACSTKLGQWAATRPDLFPETICAALTDLHTRAPMHSIRHTKRILGRTYEAEMADVFADFDETPIASGSIAQVYRAVYREPRTGQLEQVVVKVRHPHVVENMEIDLRILRALGHMAEWVPGFKWMSVSQNVACFALQMEQQLSMVNEGKNLEQFRKNFEEFPNICFPRPFLDMSNEEVLVETYETGQHVSEYYTENRTGINNSERFRKEVATLGFNSFLKMLFVDNFIHGDLHPGNVLIRERKGSPHLPQIVFLDAGLVIRLPEKERKNFLDLFAAVAAGNGKRGAQLMIERSNATFPTKERQEVFQSGMKKLFEEVTAMPISEIPFGREFIRVMHLCRGCEVRIDGNFSALMASLVVVEGLARALYSDFNILEASRPLLAKDRAFVTAYLRNRL